MLLAPSRVSYNMPRFLRLTDCLASLPPSSPRADNQHTVYVYDWRKQRVLCSGKGQMGDPPQVRVCVCLRVCDCVCVCTVCVRVVTLACTRAVLHVLLARRTWHPVHACCSAKLALHAPLLVHVGGCNRHHHDPPSAQTHRCMKWAVTTTTTPNL